ncbi:MAG TPA: hypothetical protein VFE61_22460 [Candidatus Sulfotelmatobacter sp.]|nr:hypothetical protein [Candidatus Sulfotelmatobacter sp.]
MPRSFVRLDPKVLNNPAPLGSSNASVAVLLWALGAALAGLATFCCGSPTAILSISAPSSAIAGSPFTVTVTATVSGHQDNIFNSPIHFTSSDGAAVLPADYAFSTVDAGSHTFTGVILSTAGSQSIKVTDVIAPSISATVNLNILVAATVSE